MAHVYETAHLIHWYGCRNNPLVDWISPKVDGFRFETAKQRWNHVDLKVETVCEHAECLVAVHENLSLSTVCPFKLRLIVDECKQLLLLLLCKVLSMFPLR